MREAMFYEEAGEKIRCNLCPNNCMIAEGQKGLCGTRQMMDGQLVALNYGSVSALQIDPIEKKPLYDWHPGTDILSIGSYGCNLHCPFCQNHELVAGYDSFISLTPGDVVEKTIANGLDAIAYTYNEPTVYYEMVYETAKAAKEQGLFNVLVTNGFINQEPLKKLLPYIDAANVDVKSYSDDLFHKLCGGRLKPVIEMIKTTQQYAHVEVTMLLVPELYGEILDKEAFFEWLQCEIGDVTLHLSRYFPRHKHMTPATDIDWMLKVQNEARKYFSKVHLGNVGFR